MKRFSVKYLVIKDEIQDICFKMVETTRKESVAALLKKLHPGYKINLLKIKKAQHATGRLDGGED
jgi:hypothetical protein